MLFSVLIDLVDMDGQVKNLSGRSKEYASEVVNGRETYVLIRVESEWLVRADNLLGNKIYLNVFKTHITINQTDIK